MRQLGSVNEGVARIIETSYRNPTWYDLSSSQTSSDSLEGEWNVSMLTPSGPVYGEVKVLPAEATGRLWGSERVKTSSGEDTLGLGEEEIEILDDFSTNVRRRYLKIKGVRYAITRVDRETTTKGDFDEAVTMRVFWANVADQGFTRMGGENNIFRHDFEWTRKTET